MSFRLGAVTHPLCLIVLFLTRPSHFHRGETEAQRMDRTIVSVRDGMVDVKSPPTPVRCCFGTQDYSGLGGLWGGMGGKKELKKTPNDVKLLSSHAPQETTEFCICQYILPGLLDPCLEMRGSTGYRCKSNCVLLQRHAEVLTPRLSKCKFIWE